jgi:hypothetical protein
MVVYTLLLLLGWMATTVMYALPFLGIVQNNTPSENGTGMVVIGSILIALPTLIGTGCYWWEVEERWERRGRLRSEDAILAAIYARREMRDKEEILGMEPFPLDDDLDRYLYQEHPIESQRKGWTSYAISSGYHQKEGNPRIRSKHYERLVEELTHG